MTTSAASPAGPSRHRRKQTAENWDDDFDFVPPRRSSRAESSSSKLESRHLHQPSGESRANRPAGHARSISKTTPNIKVGKAREVEEGKDEDWDAESRCDQAAAPKMLSSGDEGSRRASLQMRRGSKGPTALVLPPTASKPLGPLRTSPSSDSPLSSPIARPSHSARDMITARQALLEAPRTAPMRMSPPRPPDDPTLRKLIKRHPSAAFATTAQTVPAVSNDSSSSLSSWTRFNLSSPNLPPSPSVAPASVTRPLSRGANGSDKEKRLRHMKSGEIMPPPPMPGPGLLRRKSKKNREIAQQTEQQGRGGPEASPSAEQMRDVEGKRGFWKRLSVNAAAMGKGSPTSVKNQERLHRRSSSFGSPTKIRRALEDSASTAQPPIPPLPSTFRSPSAASSASASSSISMISSTPSGVSAQLKTSGGLTGLLRRSTSSLIRKSPSSSRVNSANNIANPPSSFTPPIPPAGAMPQMMVPARTTSRSSHTSTESEYYGLSEKEGRRNASISRGYHLPSPAPGSPYRRDSHFGSREDMPPLPQSASFSSDTSSRSRVGAGDTADDDTQMTPKKRRTRPGSESVSSKAWTGGEGWTGFPSSRTADATKPPVAAPPRIPSRTSSQINIRLPASHPMQTSTSEPPPLPAPAGLDPPGRPTYSTLRRLSSLSKKHGRRLSGGFKFGTAASVPNSGMTDASASIMAPAEEGRRGSSRLETVAGSPVKPSRTQSAFDGEKDSPEWGDARPDLRGLDRLGQPGTFRAGSVSAPSSSFKTISKPPSGVTARNLHSEWDALGTTASRPEDTGEGTPGSSQANALGARTDRGTGQKLKSGETDKERRRQSWNDFVIPRNVLDKQRELKKGIEGVKKFAGGVEALKALLDARTSLASDPDLPDDFADLDVEFAQWWEMATVLIEVGSTGQPASTAATLNISPSSLEQVSESPKRSRRITLAADEAALAADMMRRTQTQPTPQYPRVPTSTSAFVLVKSSDRGSEKDKEPRKSSLPDPQDATLLFSGPPRASPDLWRASTGRQELSKRQLEVLRTMLRTPVVDASLPSRSDGLVSQTPGSSLHSVLTADSASSTVSAITQIGGAPTSGSRPAETQGDRGLRHIFRPSVSRAATSDSHTSGRSLGHFDSRTFNQGSSDVATPEKRGPETFPSPNDSAYIVPSQSFPSPLTASTLAFGVPSCGAPSPANRGASAESTASKMRRGSKVGLAGLREFLKGLKGQKSSGDLRLGTASAPAIPTATEGHTIQHGTDNDDAPRVILQPLVLTSHVPAPAPFDTPSRPDATPTPSDTVSGFSSASPASRSTAAGPPVTSTGKERRRPGLRGIFRGGSGSWGDLVRDETERQGQGGMGSKEVGPSPFVLSPPVFVADDRRTAAAGTAVRLTDNRSASDPVSSIPGGFSLGASAPDESIEGDRTIRPRKSRIMGLGWPEEAALARDSRMSSDSDIPAEHRRAEDDEDEEEEGEEDVAETTVALTPESLPILLEYLRQCEAKLGQWKQRAETISRQHALG